MNKKWTVNDIKIELEKLDKEFGKDLSVRASDLPIYIIENKNELGTFVIDIDIYNGNVISITPVEFQFAGKLVDGTCSPEKVINVIKHEFAHYLADCSTNNTNKHNDVWKTFARMVGANPSAYDESSYKYRLVCSKCGEIVGYRHRKRDLSEYISDCCSEPIVFEKII